MDDGAGGEGLGVEELDSACAFGAKQGLAASLDDGGGADPVLVEQVGRGEGVGQLAGAPDEDVAACGLLQSADLVEQVGAHAVVSTGREATTYLVIELTWSAKGFPPLVGQACAMPS